MEEHRKPEISPFGGWLSLLFGIPLMLAGAGLGGLVWLVGAGIAGGSVGTAYLMAVLSTLPTWFIAYVVLRFFDAGSALVLVLVALGSVVKYSPDHGWPVLLAFLLMALLPSVAGIELVLNRGGRYLPNLEGVVPRIQSPKHVLVSLASVAFLVGLTLGV